jgi:hemoglobin/transferrin/lactoferrin receptor protein
VGLYVQDEITSGRWVLTPGLRFDRFDIDTDALDRPEGVIDAASRTEQALSGSAAVLFRATANLHATLSVGRAFRTPNIIERYFFGPGSQGGLTVPNPDLENETSINIDAGVKLRFPRVHGSVTFFRNRVDNFITFVPGTFNGDSTFAGQPITRVDNVGEARVEGVEVTAEYLLPLPDSRWIAFGNFSWSDAKDLVEDEPLLVAPPKGVLGVRWSDGADRLAASLTGRFVGDRDRVPAGLEPIDGFATIDARTSVDLRHWVGRSVVLRLGVENLLNATYREPLGGSLAPGRGLVSTVHFTF